MLGQVLLVGVAAFGKALAVHGFAVFENGFELARVLILDPASLGETARERLAEIGEIALIGLGAVPDLVVPGDLVAYDEGGEPPAPSPTSAGPSPRRVRQM